MDARKREAVMAMVAEKRFEYFVRKVADHEQVWGLHDRGWATVNGPGGMIALPFWPERDFAAACAAGAWASYVPEIVVLGEFLTTLLPGMVRDSRKVAVFPTDRDTCIFTSPEDLLEAIHREMWQVPAR
jgi:hypothetical protein